VPNILRSKVKALVQLHRLNAELKKRSDERVALVKEQAARTMAEESQRRASFLAEAAQVMASSLDIDTILKGSSGLTVPFLADFAAIALVDEGGATRAQHTAAVGGWDNYLGPRAAAFREKLAHELSRVVATGARVYADRLVPEDAGDDGPPGEIHGFPLVTRGRPAGALLIALGPSARHLAGADLGLAENLAGRAAASLDNCLLYAEIQGADRRKNEFLATLSHELRNPLAPIRAALHMLRTGHFDSERAAPLLETMDRQVGQMTRLVEDLLDISRITRGIIELKPEPVDVGAEIRSALESCAGPLDSGRHRVAIDLPQKPVLVHADRVRLQQILENLILNAAKYTESGGRIEVAARDDGDEVLIEVSDNGIGIEQDKLQQVWELFVQVDDSHERTRKGLGIGLALVKDLVQRHGGRVEASSDGLGRGSTFRVRLPRAEGTLQPTAREPAPKIEQAPAKVKGRRVLIVDDNVDAAETLAMMLEILGQETRQAHDGHEAIAVTRDYAPDLIFMDIGLPGISGLEACERIRRELGMNRVYLVALSGYGTEEDRRKSLAVGFDSHLVKPLDPAALPGILESAGRGSSRAAVV
jgi:signal transduction histidine kinase/ActR/RegA family two-component response regulator